MKKKITLNELKSLVKKIINEEYLLLENNNRYVLLPIHEDGFSEDFEEYNIDEDEAIDRVLEIAKNGGVNILRDKNLFEILIDSKLNKVIGGIWVSNGNDTFSFDIAIDGSYQNMGLSDILIKSVIEEYKYQKDMYDDMGEDFKMEVEVINPKLVQILKNKYGFHVVGELSHNHVLMSLD